MLPIPAQLSSTDGVRAGRDDSVCGAGPGHCQQSQTGQFCQMCGPLQPATNREKLSDVGMTSSLFGSGWRKYSLRPLSRLGRSYPLQDENLARPNHADFMVYDYNIELLHWELKSGLGLGEHQVSGDTNRSEKSVGIAVLAYLLVLRVCHHEIVPGKPWSIFQLQHALRLRVMTNQVEHQMKVKMAKTRKAA